MRRRLDNVVLGFACSHFLGCRQPQALQPVLAPLPSHPPADNHPAVLLLLGRFFSPGAVLPADPPSKRPGLGLSNSAWSHSLWEHAVSSFSTNYKTENNPALIFIPDFQELTKAGEILLVPHRSKRRVRPSQLRFVLGLCHFDSCLEFCAASLRAANPHHGFSPALAFSKVFNYLRRRLG